MKRMKRSHNNATHVNPDVTNTNDTIDDSAPRPREQPPPAPKNTTQTILADKSSGTWVPPELVTSLPASPGLTHLSKRTKSNIDDADFADAYDDVISDMYEEMDKPLLIDRVRELEKEKEESSDSLRSAPGNAEMMRLRKQDQAELSQLKTQLQQSEQRISNLTKSLDSTRTQASAFEAQLAEVRVQLFTVQEQNTTLIQMVADRDRDTSNPGSPGDNAPNATATSTSTLDRSMNDVEEEEASAFR